MFLRNTLGIFALVSQVHCARQHFPRATPGNLNATTTSNVYPSPSLCCYLDSFGVGLVLWWTSSVEITVATVSTIVYQYDNTAVTSFKTIKANSTQSLPNGVFNNFGSITISGVPTDIVGSQLAGYEADTTLMTGTEFTDPYGTVYTSPTPVWVFSELTYYTEDPTPTGSGYACPSPSFAGVGEGLEVYPSGYFIADNDTSYGQNNTGEIFKAAVPVQLKYWVESHIPPSEADPIYSSLGNCTMGFGDGIPTAHIPVTELTAGITTTTTMTGNLGGLTTTSSPLSTTPESETQPSSTPAGETFTSTPSEIIPPVTSNPSTSSSSRIRAVTSISSTVLNEGFTTSFSLNLGSRLGSGSSDNNASPGPKSDTIAGNTPGGATSTTSSTFIAVSGSSSPMIAASSIKSVSETTPTGNGANGASQAPAGPGSTNSPNGNENAGGHQTTGAGTGAKGNGNTITTQPSSTVVPVFTADGTTYTGNSVSGFKIGSSTLTPGGTVVIAGSGTSSPITYVLPTSATAVIINGVTEALSSKTVAAAITTPFLVIGSSTYTVNSASEYVIGSQTLTAGGVITASGDILSLATGGQTVVVVSGSNTKTQSLGGIIASVGGFQTGTSTPIYVTASKAQSSRGLDIWVLGAALGIGLIAVWAL